MKLNFHYFGPPHPVYGISAYWPFEDFQAHSVVLSAMPEMSKTIVQLCSKSPYGGVPLDIIFAHPLLKSPFDNILQNSLVPRLKVTEPAEMFKDMSREDLRFILLAAKLKSTEFSGVGTVRYQAVQYFNDIDIEFRTVWETKDYDSLVSAAMVDGSKFQTMLIDAIDAYITKCIK